MFRSNGSENPRINSSKVNLSGQKIWLWIFGAMFVVPEVLWGDLLKVLKISFLPIYQDVQTFTENPSIAFLVIIIEVIGISGVIYLINKAGFKNRYYLKYVFNIFLVIILLLLLLGLFFSYSISQINFL